MNLVVASPLAFEFRLESFTLHPELSKLDLSSTTMCLVRVRMIDGVYDDDFLGGDFS